MSSSRTGSLTQKPFVHHIRERFTDAPPQLIAPEVLFPTLNQASAECTRYMALTRCVFSCKLAEESLAYLTHFVDAVRLAGAQWQRDSELEAVLEKFGGDIVQAVQALKESRPQPTQELEEQLLKLWTSLKECRRYCDSTEPEPLVYPFARSARQVKDVLGLLFPSRAHLKPLNDISVSQLSVDISKHSNVEKFILGHHQIPRLFNGLWQLSSPAWGSSTAEKQDAALAHLIGDAELIYGEFRNRLAPEVREQVYAATKWCVFSPTNQPVTNAFVLSAVKERCRRLGGRVELLQFHCSKYEAKEYLEILGELVSITKTHPDLVSTIGLCNFDSAHTEKVCEYLLSKQGSIGIVSNQVQFSMFDSRPLQQMTAVCTKYGLKLLTYGSLCGGLLSEKWLGQPVPEIYAENNQLTPSQRKYFDMIQTWGTWADFQKLLHVLSSTADKHGVSLTNVATRWVLQQPAVGAVIVGTRLGVSAHGDENLKVFDFKLDDGDIKSINDVALGENGERSLAVLQLLGDCGHEYRAMH
ncbi:aldo/keto reductase [Seiridium cupressi]